MTAMRGAVTLVMLATVGLAGCVGAEDEVYARDGHSMTGLMSDCQPGQVGRLSGGIYALPRETRALPVFTALSPIGAVCMDRLAVRERNGPPGFPGVTSRFEWFGVDLEGSFIVAEPGPYQFRLTVDDGAKLIIDGADVIDNDGYHPTRSAEAGVVLTAGVHHIHVPYWQGPGPLALELSVARPGEPYRIFHLDRPLGARAP